MTFPRLTNGFYRMADADLAAKAAYIISQVENNPDFPNPTPTIEELKATADAFAEGIIKAGTGDRSEAALKNKTKNELALLLHLLGCYVLLAARGDRTKIAGSGFSMAKDHSLVEITKPANLKVVHSNQTGQLVVSVKKVKGAVAYMHQYATDVTSEEAWRSVTCSATKCCLTGLQPGTTYYIRVAVVGTRWQVLYSDVVSKVAA